MKINLQKIKLGFLGLVLFLQASIFLSPNIVFGQGLTNPIDTTQPASSTLPIYQGVDGSIRDYLCTPTGQGTDLYDCIGRLYRFGISAGAVALVFFIVMAGYLYITGGEAAKGKAKGVILSALTGMGILLGSYTLLSFINPELVKIKMIQPPIFNALDLPKCEEVGFGVRCIVSSGQVYNPGGGALSSGQWKDLINKYSGQYSVDPCVGHTILRKESSGNPDAIGHDNHSRSADTFVKANAPYHGLDFRLPNWSHGIGLTQITIFPEGSRQGGANWPSFPTINGRKTPARRADTIPVKGENSSKWYTINDLLNPDTSVRLAIGKMAYHLQQTNNNLEASFKAYNGGQVYATSAMKIYNDCKQGVL